MNTNKNTSAFQFSNPSLIEAIFIENLSYKNNFKDVGQLNFKINKIKSPISKMTSEKDRATVALTITTDDRMELTPDTPCFIRVTMRASFVWKKEDFNNVEIEKLLSINAPSLLLGYIRPKIVELTEDSDLPTQHLQFIDFSRSV